MKDLLFSCALVVCVLVSVSASSASEYPFGLPALKRGDFNRLAMIKGVPLYWLGSSDVLKPSDLIVVGDPKLLNRYVRNGRFTPYFINTYRKLVNERRLEAVERELAQGRRTIIFSDFRKSPERRMVREIVKAAGIINRLYWKQRGVLDIWSKIPPSDHSSRALFLRNSGPWCVAPKTEDDPFCSASLSFPGKRSGAYPSELLSDPDFCKKLKKMPNAKELLNPFTVVRKRRGKLVALPLTAVYGREMKQVAARLRRAASYLGKDEKAFKKYLLKAAKGFETNYWEDADEAWVAMNDRNSKWYLRIAPDEVYFDPCQEKAGFHVSFGTVDPAGAEWRNKLMPLREKMERNLAELIGNPYKPRDVKFHMPDFVKIVLNAGDSKKPLSVTVGQSLPNWGKIAREGRGRTVVMTNFYTDPDSVATRRKKAASLFDEKSLSYIKIDKEISTLNTILHEAMHNFGPHSDYRINGKRPAEIFGGRLATVLEELKAQTGALWLLNLLRKEGILSEERVREAYADAMFWCMNHLSRGLFTPTGRPRTYSQLSAVQIGRFVREGALKWIKDKDGNYVLSINFDSMPKAVEGLMRDVGRVKARGDKKAAEKLVNDFVTGRGLKLVKLDLIKKRLSKFDKASFDYVVYY